MSRPEDGRPVSRGTDPEFLDRVRERPHKLSVAAGGMAATAHPGATAAAVAMLERGGNAIDAAVAAAFALGVCEPAASGLGGQTMILLRHAPSRRTLALDGSSRAPHRAAPGLLGKRARRRGYRSCTVPSTPAVLAYALDRYGTVDIATVLAPAVALAEEGYAVSELQHALFRRELKHLRAGTAAPLLLRDGRRPYRPGQLLRQPVLAATLRRLAREGIEDFYTGGIARAIDADMANRDGLIRLDDLAQIPWPIERRPLRANFEGLRVRTFPPPGAGRTLVEMLNLLAEFSARRRDPDTPEGAVLLAHVIRRAFLDRRDRPFDPNFYGQVEEKRMLSEEHARRLARAIRRSMRWRTVDDDPPIPGPRPPGGDDTTHLSVMDAQGNVVALTQSIERVFGACVATPELGFLYNNYLMAFEHEDIGHPYYLRPNAVPWASVAPTIVSRKGRPWLAIGSPGSERIAPSIMLVLLRLLRGQTAWEAVDAPRLYCSLEGLVSLEASRMRDDIPETLERHGFTVQERDPYSFYLGCIQLVMRQGRQLVGIADPRRDGAAGGIRS